MSENSRNTRFFGSNQAIHLISNTLSDAKIVRIATAYWESSGYECLRHVLANKRVLLLVGRETGGRDNIIEMINNFVQSLTLPPLSQRTSAMRTMLDALKNGLLFVGIGDDDEITSFMDARYLYHHAKLYIADEDAVVVTSANLSRHGLIHSREAGIQISDKDDVCYFVERFDYYFDKAELINKELIEKLEQYVNAQPPYDVYIRSLIELYELPDTPVPTELSPLASYQRPVVARILQALQDYHGGMLIASTGLGKTVMAAHIVAYLRMEGRIDKVIVISPAGLREQWRRYMWISATPSREFSYHALSTDISRSYIARTLDDELRRVNERTLIILDESHHMRNKDDANNENKLRYKRIQRAVRDKNAMILMLTATPFSRDLDDVNSQLDLMPLYEFANFSTHDKRKRVSWRITRIEELSDLPPCAVLTTPSVVNRFSEQDEEGNRYVRFSDKDLRYFPRLLKFYTEKYENKLDSILERLLAGSLLNHLSPSVADNQLSLLPEDNFPSQKIGFFRATIMHQFCSSPARVEEVMYKLANGDYENMRFAYQKDLTQFVSDNISMVKNSKNIAHDIKLSRVLEIVQDAVLNRRKVIIFCFYPITADYITNMIRENSFGINIRVETTAGKEIEQTDRIIRRFAPIANDSMELTDENEVLDVLVATGILAEGFNLQDANVLINYDLPWTVLTLAQRLGRILRPWAEPREIFIYNFMPSTMQNHNIKMAVNWQTRLQERNRQHQVLADIPVLLRESADADEIEMQNLARHHHIFDEDVKLDFNQTLDFLKNTQQIMTSTFWTDLSILHEDDRNYVKKLPFGFRSAKLTKGKQRLFILFQYKKRYYPTLFDAKGQLLMDSEHRDHIMNIIRCDYHETLPSFEFYPNDDEFDTWIEMSRQSWAKRRKMSSEMIYIVCSMALLPSK